jgi:hypothetical protein
VTPDEAARFDNHQAVEAIVRMVAVAHLRPESTLGTVRAADLQLNYFSMGLPIEAAHEGRTRAVFVKIPKEDLRRRGGRIMPLSAADRRLADEEYRSLTFLAEHWPGGEFDVSFVRPLGFHETFNAIVTERVAARDGCEQIRAWDLERRLGRASSRRRLRDVMARLGRSFRRFHDRFAEERPIDGPRLAAKLERYGAALAGMTRQQAVLDRARASAARIAGADLTGRDTWTLKGIDIRNVFIGEGDRIVMLDPGKMKRACAEADLARFLVTYRILWWGSPLFLLGLRPDPGGEAAFLEAYYGAADAGGLLLRSQFVKELLKHWHTAYHSLSLKPWSAAAKRLIASTVIDPYYTRHLGRELDRMERGPR